MLRWLRPGTALHFDGEPDRFASMRKLFPTQQTARTLYAEPDPRKFRHSRLQAMAERILSKMTRRAA